MQDDTPVYIFGKVSGLAKHRDALLYFEQLDVVSFAMKNGNLDDLLANGFVFVDGTLRCISVTAGSSADQKVILIVCYFKLVLRSGLKKHLKDLFDITKNGVFSLKKDSFVRNYVFLKLKRVDHFGDVPRVKRFKKEKR